MSATKGQHRGHCQACGRIHVVEASAQVAKHGYRVAGFGFFNGVCIGGRGEQPLEVDRRLTDKLITDITAQAQYNEGRASMLRSGQLTPTRVVIGSRRENGKRVLITGAWNQGTLQQRSDQVELEAGEAESYARMARAHVKSLTALATLVHGKPLIDRDAEELARVNERKAKTAPIAGAYRTKIAQKRDLEELSRKYSILVKDIKDTYLEKRDTAGEALYFALPFELHQWRTKHSLQVLDTYPEHKPQVDAIEVLVINRNEIKARPVIK